MANGFYWKPSVGPLDQRPGHWNGMWQYWSTDGELAPPTAAVDARFSDWRQSACCGFTGRRFRAPLARRDALESGIDIHSESCICQTAVR